MRHAREAERLLNEARGLSTANDYLGARRAYIKAANRFEELMQENPDDRQFRRQFALAANNLAWFLATCPNEKVRDAESAVFMGKKAVAAIPSDGNSLNTLAVAQFRAGDYDTAWDTFAKSMELRDGGDSFDWYFMAQIEAKRSHPDQAKELYEKADSWMSSFRPRDPELFRFKVEAAAALGLPKPVMTGGDPNAPGSPDRVFPGPSSILKRGG